MLLHCHRGCSQEAVIQALRARGLWPDAPRHLRSNAKVAVTYDYRDESGVLLFQVVRLEPKGFYLRRPDGHGSWIKNLDGVRRVLYRLPEVLAAPADATVCGVEGEKDADRLAALGIVATTNPGGAGKWSPEYSDALRGRHLAILPDNDDPGRAHAQQVAQALHGVAASAKIVELPGLPEKGDVSDYLDAGGTRESLEALVAKTPEWTPAPVPDLALLLDETVAFIRQYVVLAPEQADTLALFDAHAWTFEAAETTPYIHISSPTPQSAKTRTLEVLNCLVRRPWFTGRATAAVLVRKIDAECPTLLLDETDAAFGSGDEYAETLRGVLNTGHRKGGKVSVCVGLGAQMSYADFSTFCPKAFAGLKRLPDTVMDRSIPIRLRRRRPDEPVKRFRFRAAEELARPLRVRFAAWAADAEKLRDAQPDVPEELDDRAAEAWEPLLVIADLAGGDWPERARRAALVLSAGQAREDNSIGVRLLRDIRRVFEQQAEDRIATAGLLAALNADEEAPWGTWEKTGLKPHDLAKLLKPFDIRPGTVKLTDGRTAKGYKREDFIDSWTRHLPPDPSPPSPSASDAAIVDSSTRHLPPQVTAAETPQNPRPDCMVTAVTDLPSRNGEGVTPPPLLPGMPTDGGLRAAFLRVGQVAGWPPVPFVFLAAGEKGWRDFAATAPDTAIRWVLDAFNGSPDEALAFAKRWNQLVFSRPEEEQTPKTRMRRPEPVEAEAVEEPGEEAELAW